MASNFGLQRPENGARITPRDDLVYSFGLTCVADGDSAASSGGNAGRSEFGGHAPGAPGCACRASGHVQLPDVLHLL